MAQLKAARAAAVPSASSATPDTGAQLGLASACISGADAAWDGPAPAAGGRPPLVVLGHRGKGMNALASPDARMRGDVRENTIRAFNDAARVPGVAYVEFDVQVTKDGCPIIFHDNFIYTQDDNGEISGRRVTDLHLDEFLSYGPQKDHGKAGKPLLRKLKDGRILKWDVQSEDALCTLQEAFEGVDQRVGFNVELKFDDDVAYTEEELTGILQAVLRVVYEHADGRHIIFSSFQPDAAQLIRKLQDKYPVYFLTNGGTQVYADARRNSLEAAQAVPRRRPAGGSVGGAGDSPAAGGGGHDQGGGQAGPAHVWAAQQRAGGGVRAAPVGRGRRDRRPGTGDRRGRVGIRGGAGVVVRRRQDGDGGGRGDAELLAAGDLLPAEADPRASAVTCVLPVNCCRGPGPTHCVHTSLSTFKTC